MEIKPIKTDSDHREALIEIERLWNAPEGTPEGDKLEVMIALVAAYEQKRWPVDPLDPVETIVGHMDLNGFTQADLAKLLGSRSRASEVLNRKRALTLEMIHKLHKEWQIPASLLIQPYKLDAA
jgi:HTH-type transcriptional regulator / antitoxin HigA